MDVAIGVDSHKATLEVAALDSVGKHLATKRFRNDPRGLDEILSWVRSFPATRVIGIECSATFGAALARHLLASGEDVREVPGNLSHAEAKLTGRGKSDPTDAQAIARIVLRRPCGCRKLDRPSLTRHLAAAAGNRLGDAVACVAHEAEFAPPRHHVALLLDSASPT